VERRRAISYRAIAVATDTSIARFFRSTHAPADDLIAALGPRQHPPLDSLRVLAREVEVEAASRDLNLQLMLGLYPRASILAMLVITVFLIAVLVPEVVFVAMMVLTILLRVYSTVMTCEGIAVVRTGLAIVVSTGTVVVAGSCHSRGQRREHDGKHKYLHFQDLHYLATDEKTLTGHFWPVVIRNFLLPITQ
jgi:hypothetical protein